MIALVRPLRVLVEGGGETVAGLLAAGLVDEVYVFIAPRFLGGAGAPTGVAGLGWDTPEAGPRLRNVGVSQVGKDVLVHGWL
jgi:diaminohydroxyphosphoribosylaminopyrimidine deaminase/5-amino-6-(5-phosphoribosylamino)uracil reductase